MNTKIFIIIVVGLGLIIAGGGYLFVLRSTPLEQNSASSNREDISTYSADQVATHDSRGDCWTIINGNVYEITSYIIRHPGGTEIERACGIDATELFNQRRTSDGETVGSGTPHSSAAQEQLEKLKIGKLSD